MKGNLKMKKLNNKGFTLIELLAVIVILAIVVAITIPAVLSSINNARSSAFQTSVNTVADWVEREYQAYLINDESVQHVDDKFRAVCGNVSVTNHLNLDGSGGSCLALTKEFLQAAGVKPENYDLSASSITVNSSGRACVTLKASSNGDYSNDASNATTATKTSSGC